MSIDAVNNIQEYVATAVIKHLKERDEKILKYEQMLKVCKVDECNVCKKFIGVRLNDDYLGKKLPNKFLFRKILRFF